MEPNSALAQKVEKLLCDFMPRAIEKSLTRRLLLQPVPSEVPIQKAAPCPEGLIGELFQRVRTRKAILWYLGLTTGIGMVVEIWYSWNRKQCDSRIGCSQMGTASDTYSKYGEVELQSDIFPWRMVGSLYDTMEAPIQNSRMVPWSKWDGKAAKFLNYLWRRSLEPLFMEPTERVFVIAGGYKQYDRGGNDQRRGIWGDRRRNSAREREEIWARFAVVQFLQWQFVKREQKFEISKMELSLYLLCLWPTFLTTGETLVCDPKWTPSLIQRKRPMALGLETYWKRLGTTEVKNLNSSTALTSCLKRYFFFFKLTSTYFNYWLLHTFT